MTRYMKSILISIAPKWSEKIANGIKTVEVRKTVPKLQTPFKVYIYCTIPRKKEDVQFYTIQFGTVIGEFVCDKVDYWQYEWKHDVMHIQDMSRLSCVRVDELLEYANGGRIYGWHISDLVIYDKPRELSEFHRPCNSDCMGICEYGCINTITRPPQSWCYVEEVHNVTEDRDSL